MLAWTIGGSSNPVRVWPTQEILKGCPVNDLHSV